MITAANEQGRRENLKRFGYRLANHHKQEAANLSTLWNILRGDFHFRSVTPPDFDALRGETLAAAWAYIDHRAELDELMDTCDNLHARILREGPAADLVELYVVARDTYEDAVERFGELRVATQLQLDDDAMTP